MPEIKTVFFDDDVLQMIKDFQDYMNQDSRIPVNFSRAVNFICDAYLKNFKETEVTQQ